MNLKRNDKIILIVGVVILIIAGAGIALYKTPTENGDIDTIKKDGNYYDYSWESDTKTKSIQSPMVEKDSPFEETFTITGIPDGAVLTQLTVMIDWIDDKTFGILRTKGQDTLTIEVIQDGKPLDDTSVMEGNHSFSFNINSMPRDGRINASSTSDAVSKLNNEYKDMNEADFEVTLTIEPGEPRWRLLFRKDKGNIVDISAKYTYYMYDLTEVDDDDMKSSGGDGDDGVKVTNHYLGEFYVNLGYGRGMI